VLPLPPPSDFAGVAAAGLSALSDDALLDDDFSASRAFFRDSEG
jgi:hypothetical protein